MLINGAEFGFLEVSDEKHKPAWEAPAHGVCADGSYGIAALFVLIDASTDTVQDVSCICLAAEVPQLTIC